VTGRSVVLDWRAGDSLDQPTPCSICWENTWTVSPRGTPCHKACAESWVEQHPEAVEGPGARALGFRGWQR
jgi:hypothetical protein